MSKNAWYFCNFFYIYIYIYFNDSSVSQFTLFKAKNKKSLESGISHEFKNFPISRKT